MFRDNYCYINLMFDENEIVRNNKRKISATRNFTVHMTNLYVSFYRRYQSHKMIQNSFKFAQNFFLCVIHMPFLRNKIFLLTWQSCELFRRLALLSPKRVNNCSPKSCLNPKFCLYVCLDLAFKQINFHCFKLIYH